MRIAGIVEEDSKMNHSSSMQGYGLAVREEEERHDRDHALNNPRR